MPLYLFALSGEKYVMLITAPTELMAKDKAQAEIDASSFKIPKDQRETAELKLVFYPEHSPDVFVTDRIYYQM